MKLDCNSFLHDYVGYKIIKLEKSHWQDLLHFKTKKTQKTEALPVSMIHFMKI